MLQGLFRLGLGFRLAILAVGGAGLAAAWYLASPLFINYTVEESLPAAVAPAGRQSDSGAPESAQPAVLAAGRFGEIDSIHKGDGTALLLRLPDGQRVLRFEDFKVTNGPDLYVYLSGHPGPRDGRQLHNGGAFEVARLKGNIGSQNYELPADLDLSQFSSVVIYCKRFSVVFSTAPVITGS